jgi:hypothetical protein
MTVLPIFVRQHRGCRSHEVAQDQAVGVLVIRGVRELRRGNIHVLGVLDLFLKLLLLLARQLFVTDAFAEELVVTLATSKRER